MEHPIAIYTCQNPLPSEIEIAITNNNVGIDQKTFIIHTTTLSKYPPKYPPRTPKKTPRTVEINTAIKPIDNETLVPKITLLNKSLP